MNGSSGRQSTVRVLIFLFFFISLCRPVSFPVFAQVMEAEVEPMPEELGDLDIEQLAQIRITLPFRSSEKLSKAAAAVTVLTSEDIRRSGVTTIPDALRLVPGLQVGRIDSHTWAVASRGFIENFVNKLLVMIDGRTVYTPLFSGVFWDVQDTLLEDIERIEVVRGPGATLWGANAVNGVINIVTKSAKDTQGVLISGGGGTEERGFANVRYGAPLGENAFFRIYGKYLDRDDSVLQNGEEASDSWDMWRGGFRVDWEPSDVNLFTLQGDIYDGDLQQMYTMPTFVAPFAEEILDTDQVCGGNLLGRWTRTFSEESDLNLQVYYDKTKRVTPIFEEDRDTFDVDFQHGFVTGERQKWVWGLGYRRTHDDTVGSISISLNPPRRTLDLYSAFIQDEITLFPERLRLTLGWKLEHNDFTGFEIQPNGRLLYTPHERHTAWAAVSRAVRTPSRIEDDFILNLPGDPPPTTALIGNDDFDSEVLIAYELGYRVQAHDRVSVDVAGFYNDYNKLRSLERIVPGPVSPRVFDNQIYGEVYGVEVSTMVQAHERWRLYGGYSYLQMALHTREGSLDAFSETNEGASPRHQFFVRSLVDLGKHFEFDSTVRYVDNLPVTGAPAYITLDVRLAWKPNKDWELAVVGQNLLDDRHPEFFPTSIETQRTEVERGFYAKLTWRF